MNRFGIQCHERCFCDFCNSSFLIRGSVTVHWPPVSILKSGMKHLRRDKSYQFQPPKFTQKEVSVLELSKSKSTGQREVGCWCFPKLASYTRKKSYTLRQPGSVFKVCESLEERLEGLQSLSLNFSLTKFLRTIERAFVQVLHSFTNCFPNTRVRIS